MAQISGSIPGVFDGISQQPALIRSPNQGELQINALSSVVNGLSKRPALEMLARMYTGTLDVNPGSFLIEMSDGTKVAILVTKSGGVSTLRLWNADTGAAYTITDTGGIGYGYIQSPYPNADLRFIPIGDYIFVLNRTINTAMRTDTLTGGTLKGAVQLFSDLPTSGNVIGDVWRVDGSPDTGIDNYFVIYQNGGTWAECANPGQQYRIGDWSMPKVLVRNGTGGWDWKAVTWTDRMVGELNASIYNPSFIGKPINDIQFFRNRLWFHSGRNLIGSSYADFYNFFPATVTAQLDTDPIDVSVAGATSSDILTSIPFNRELLIFTQSNQYLMTGGAGSEGFLSPKTVTVSETTKFPVNGCPPVAAGSNAYFGLDRGNFTQLREYYVDGATLMHDAADITAHVSAFIPIGLFHLSASAAEDIIIAQSSADYTKLYVYKYFWGSDKKLQSSWSYWQFDPGDVVLKAEIIGSSIYLIIGREGGFELNKIDLTYGRTDGNLPYQVLLDRVYVWTGTYSATTNLTTWTLPYPESWTNLEAVLGSSFGTGEGTRLALTRVDSTHFTAIGNYSAGGVRIGRPYEMRYRFSPQFYHRKDGGAVAGKLKLRNFRINYVSTGYFRVEVSPFYQTVSYTYDYLQTGLTLGTGLSIIGSPSMYSGVLTVPVMSDNDKVAVDIVNDSPQPCIITSADWTGTFVQKAQTV